MREEHWNTVTTVVRELTPLRADAELGQVSAYLNTHRDAADFFAFLDELAGPGGAALARGPLAAQHYAAVRAACQRFRALPPEALPEAVAWAARLLRYEVASLPPAPQAAAPPAPVARPPAAPPPAAPPSPPARPAAARPPAARSPAPSPRVQPPATARPAAPARAQPPAPERPPAPAPERAAQPAAAQQAPRPARPARPSTLDEMLRALQAQFGAGRGGRLAEPERRPPDPTEAKRQRLLREQEEIRERYRRQREQDDQ